ncbi:MAG: isocitrate lyase, partial [Proteobacteria bacterium]|nr:isocitrate lyase [Pseudomonadota bacterium]
MPNTTDTLVKNRLESLISNYSEEDVEKLRGTFNVEYTVSKNLSKKLWKLLNTE